MNSYRARLQRMYPDCWPWISLARRIPGQLTDDEMSSLFRLARARTPAVDPVILALGAGAERASLLLAAGVSDKARPRFFAPDHDARPLQRALRFGNLDRVVQPLSEANWNCPIDILFVHSTDELSQWSRFVKPRGIVIIRGAAEHLPSPAYEDLRVVDGLAWATRQCATDEPELPVDPVDFAAARRQDYVRRAAREIAEARHAIEALKSSWSWRLTAPLRWMIEAALKAACLIDKPSGISRWLRFKNELRASGLLEQRYFRDRLPRTPDPLLRYLVRGVAEGANPNELFDSAYYAARYPDVAASGLPPVIHYLRHGAYQGFDPHPYFDSSFYLEQNPDVREIGLNPLAHYLAPGIAEGRDPNPWFDTSEYLEQNPDVATFALNPLTHQTEFWSRPPCSR